MFTKKIHNIFAVAAMFFVILAALLTSFQIAIYGDADYSFYQSLYEKYHVTEDLHMEMSDVMEVTDYMMAYLIGEEDELSIVTDVDGKEQDFFNEQDRLHMADVRNLFLHGLKLRNVLLVVAAVLIGALFGDKADWKNLLSKAYMRALVVFLALTAFLGIAFAVDFTRCFTIFHEIFFTNDLWLFDPETDYMIRMLPEGFFADMVIRIGIVFLCMLAGLYFIIRLCRTVGKKKGNK